MKMISPLPSTAHTYRFKPSYKSPGKKKRRLAAALLSALIILAPYSAAGAENAFRNEFIINYKANRFPQQAELVKKNKEAMPGEIKALTAEALSPDRDFEDRMYLLDIANAMGSMYKYWHGDEKPLLEVETIQKMEIARERQRAAEAEKWARYEKLLGNFIMKEHLKQMEAEGLNPVIFPHWLHRVWFQCKVCHQDIFVMKRGGNDISKTHILEGKQCGVCHADNGIAFGTKGNCERCHNAGKEGAGRLQDMANLDHKKIKEAASRLGAEWNYENLPAGRIPIDRWGFIDWLKLKELKVFNPVISLTKGFKDEVRDNKILFESGNDLASNVLFDHKVHSTWIKCSTCHPAVFKDSLGGNHIKMTDMSAGKFCGHCHGKVSFTFADCLRCHKVPKGSSVSGALIHEFKIAQ
ncbi:MAG: cytochrome c3 family protein [Deltaproteobacteria bacterium]|nr:cytochrome c3 family protein [Deltaproteobacteria bacterium]